jgi:hypothetical protein
MGPQVKVAEDDLRVVDHGALVYVGYLRLGENTDLDEHHLFVGTLEGVGSAQLSSLRSALLTWHQRYSEPHRFVTVELCEDPEEGFSPFSDDSGGEFVFLLAGKRLLIQARAQVDTPPTREATHRLLAPLLKRHGATCVDAGVERHGVVAVDWPTRGRTVADAWSFQRELSTLLWAASSGELSPSTALDLLRAGRGDLLRGQPESAWLEAKAVPYDLDDKNVKYELGKDVAAMANSRDGGIIVMGMSNEKKRKRSSEVDTIGGYNAIDLKRISRQKYRDLVARRVYPTLTGFDVELIEGSEKDQGIAVLVIPRQPEEKRPFLVAGFIEDGNVMGNHVLLPWRREADIDAMDPVAIHDRIRLGEQAIAGGGEVLPLG